MVVPPTGIGDGADAVLPAERARLVRLCARLAGDGAVAEDLAQETLLEAWRQRHKLREPAGRAMWLAAIARNVCLRWRRRRGRDPVYHAGTGPGDAALDAAFEARPDAAGDVMPDLERDELALLLDRALALLPLETRAVLIERYIHDSPHAEVAARLGLSEGAVAKRLQRGRLVLRRVLTTELRDEAAAWGLVAPAAAGWQETRIWCSGCGRRRLLGRFERPDGVLAFRCPECTPDPAGARSEFRLANPHFAQLLAGIVRYKPALFRTLAWVHDYYRRGLAEGVVPCTNCGHPTPLRRSPPVTGARATDPRPHLTLRCPACDERGSVSLSGLVLALPDARRFWRDHPRMRLLPAREVECQGQAAFVTRLESVTGADRLDVISARGTYALLAVRGDGVANPA